MFGIVKIEKCSYLCKKNLCENLWTHIVTNVVIKINKNNNIIGIIVIIL